MLEIDHLFVFVAPPKEGDTPAEAILLQEAGFVESYRRNHPGQGTTNICYCFDNAYLELLWVNDIADITSPVTRGTKLFERSQWQETNTSPFGIALRPEIPFETWDYRPSFLPTGMSIPITKTSIDAHQPFIFTSPGGQRPDHWREPKSLQQKAPIGAHTISSVSLDIPRGSPQNNDLGTLEKQGLLHLNKGSNAHKMILSLADKNGQVTHHLNLPNCRVTEAL
ncbi:VOC family protein [Kiloniella spongiae]|uniref:VOC family protein n=1 Tax=Kiloniella spongiae TaxID=1489064 RepID=UPI000699CD74|nr:VOC family protein [Kiloniella spongiae]